MKTRTQRSETVQDHLAKTMLRLIVEHGLDSVTSSDVVKAAGITRAAMVRYCPTVDDLWRLTADSHRTAHDRGLAARPGK